MGEPSKVKVKDHPITLRNEDSPRIYGSVIWCPRCEDYRELARLLDDEACYVCRLVL